MTDVHHSEYRGILSIYLWSLCNFESIVHQLGGVAGVHGIMKLVQVKYPGDLTPFACGLGAPSKLHMLIFCVINHMLKRVKGFSRVQEATSSDVYHWGSEQSRQFDTLIVECITLSQGLRFNAVDGVCLFIIVCPITGLSQKPNSDLKCYEIVSYVSVWRPFHYTVWYMVHTLAYYAVMIVMSGGNKRETWQINTVVYIVWLCVYPLPSWIFYILLILYLQFATNCKILVINITNGWHSGAL